MGFAAAVCWGLMPVYFKLLDSVGALETVAHRIIWTVPLLIVILALRRSLPELWAALGNPKLLRMLVLSALLIAANWLIYIWAVLTDHIVAASLGYFISPLLSVLLGTVFLKERLSRWQWLAIAIAAVGVAILAASAWQTLWISLVLAGSWSLYSLVRKLAVVGPLSGLAVETGLLAPLFMGYLIWLSSAGGGMQFGEALRIDLLLLGAAVVTAVPLLLFAGAVQRVPLTTLGLMQYIAPILQFLFAVFIFGEPLTSAQLWCFALIWTGLVIFSADAWRTARASDPMPAAS
jgi:chloramphenicol-sensitive protein RarD